MPYIPSETVRLTVGELDVSDANPVPTKVAVTSTSNGVTTLRILSAATTNLTSVKASAGKVVSGMIANTTAATKYVKLYNKASAPVLASDTPVATLPVPPNTTLGIYSSYGNLGLSFTLGIALAITGAQADIDTTVTAVGDVVVNLGYV